MDYLNYLDNLEQSRYSYLGDPAGYPPHSGEKPGFHPRRFLRRNLDRFIFRHLCTGAKMASSPPEFLLPQIRKAIVPDEFDFITSRRDNEAWSKERLKKEITRLGHWEYYCAFSHGLSTAIHGTFNEHTRRFHRFRSKLICETVADLLGGGLAESTVLDIACHCGVMALDMASRGARRVDGIDVRKKNIDQARFLKKYYGIRNADFEVADLYAFDPPKSWDVVMCLGVMYHVVRPLELLDLCFRHCTRFTVVDTICHRQPISAYHVVRGKRPEVAIESTRPIEFHPTYRAVIDSMEEAGFKRIVELIGECETPVDGYRDFTRRCFIGFKQ